MTTQVRRPTSETNATSRQHKARSSHPTRRASRTEFDVHSWYERYHAEHADDPRLAGVPFN